MAIEIKPETEQLVRREIENGHFRSVDEIIVEGVHAWRERNSPTHSDAGERQRAVEQALDFARNRPVVLDDISIRGSDSRRPSFVSQWVVDASLALGWYLKDEEDREYNLAILSGLRDNEAIVPPLWIFEVSNGLVMAHRRKRLSLEDLRRVLTSLKALPIVVDPFDPGESLALAQLALEHQLTAYDAAYLELAMRRGLATATKDNALKRAMSSRGVASAQP